MNTMTQITQMPVIKGPEKSFKPSAQVEDSLTFSSFLKEATKVRQSRKEADSSLKDSSSKEKPLQSKDSEKPISKEDAVTSSKEKVKDGNQGKVSEAAKELGNLNQTPVKAEVLDTQIIPTLGQEISEDVTAAIETLTEAPKVQDMSEKNLDFPSPLHENREVVPSKSEVKMDVPVMNQTVVEEPTSKMTPNEPIISEVKTKDNFEEKVTAQILPGLAKEQAEESKVKDHKSKEFNQIGIKTDIESKSETSQMTKVPSGSLKVTTSSDGEDVPLDENVENVKNLLDELQPKGKVLDNSEVDNLKTDTGIKDQFTPALSVEKSAMDFRIQPKATPINEHFQKNLELATENIMSRVTTLKEGANTTMTVKLFPKDLGEIEISLLLNDGKLTGKILTDHKDVRELFLKNMEELTNTLKDNKVNVAKFEVGEFTQNSFGEGKQDESRRLLQLRGLRPYGQKDLNLPEEAESTKNLVQKGLNILA